MVMEVLMDKVRRWEFDFVDVLDYKFLFSCEEGEFFEIFMSYFYLLFRFSEIKLVLICDDLDVLYEDVCKYYIFWVVKFNLWREFLYEKENDTETAYDRDYRR